MHLLTGGVGVGGGYSGTRVPGEVGQNQGRRLLLRGPSELGDLPEGPLLHILYLQSPLEPEWKTTETITGEIR